MILYPAIDLKDGKCVRLYKGRMEQETVFNDSPSDQAIKFANDGCEWLSIIINFHIRIIFRPYSYRAKIAKPCEK